MKQPTGVKGKTVPYPTQKFKVNSARHGDTRKYPRKKVSQELWVVVSWIN